MDDTTRQTIEHCAQSSKDGSAHFPDIVKALIGAGVESYFADYRASATRYYLPDGDTHAVPLVPPGGVPISERFDSAALQQAIRGAQAGRVMYPEFLRLSRAAGCVGYITWLAGQQVTYFGRLGETHVEPFPGRT
ncbi:MAG TPA: DUF1398 family protein [Rhizobacter sp.]|nr:DUF1398 family protein [Rhizobacter sp.]